MQHAFAAAGLPEPAADAVREVIGLSLSRAITGLMDESLQIDAPLYQHITQAYRDNYRLAEESIDLFPDVKETLEVLRSRGYWLGVVTGKSRPGLLRVLESFELGDLFYVWRTADCTHSKPHPAMVLECMLELGVPADRTWVVGDACFDMQMAVAAEVEALGVSFGVASSDELLQAGARRVVNDFAELLAYFPRLPDQVL
ncbi:MAG: HAD-IA family hydrolase [Mariprofundus sp.]|nr:HAD-IA family hydrolase [Mariprofundus sp.]